MSKIKSSKNVNRHVKSKSLKKDKISIKGLNLEDIGPHSEGKNSSGYDKDLNLKSEKLSDKLEEQCTPTTKSHSLKVSPKKDQNKSNRSSFSKPRKKDKNIIESVKDLPEKYQRKLEMFGINPTDTHGLIALVQSLFFVSKVGYKVKDVDSFSKEKRLYADKKMFEKAKSQLKDYPKYEIKKFTKNTEFSGKGGYGYIYSSKDLRTNKKIAIKKLSVDTEKSFKKAVCEIAFLSVCDHPNIVKFIDAWYLKEDQQIWIVNEYIDGGTLQDVIKCTKFTELQVAYVARELLKALKYLHSLGYVHRDIKSSNIMLSTNGFIKLIDFGLCCEVLTGSRINMVGSPYWIPPEMILNKNYKYSVDIWSFAVVLLEMFLSQPPNSNSRLYSMYTTATSGLKDFIPREVSPLAKEFLSSCLEMDPEKRPTAEELLNHPYLHQPKIDKKIKKIFRCAHLTNNLVLSGLK